MKRITGLVAAGSMVTATLALAHAGATGVTLERMQGMTAMRDIMRDIAPYIQGDAPYDALAVSEAGYVIARYGGAAMLDLFPEGSTTGVTYAKTEIWSEWAQFEALAEELQSYGNALSKAATLGPEGAPKPQEQTVDLSEDVDTSPEDRRANQIATLMGYDGSSTPASPMEAMSNAGRAPQLSDQLSVTEIFAKISGTCSACHARFRDGKG